MAWVSTAPLRPCAARAALREQARSYICFGPIMSVGLPGPPCWFALGVGQGRQAHGLGFSSALETVRRPRGASRASPLLHLFRASYVWAIAWSALFFWFETVSGPLGAWLGFSSALETVRRPRGASRASPLLHLFRTSYVCEIAWSALFFRLETVSRLPGACLKVSGALATVRRPRGASRASPLLHLFRASYVCGIAWTALLVRLGIGSGPPGAWLGLLQRPRDRAPPARRFASKLCSYICFGPIMSGGLPGPPCWFALGLGQGRQVHGLGFYSALETVRRPRGASRASPVPHLFRASYVCAIAWSALIIRLEIGSGPPCACLGFLRRP